MTPVERAVTRRDSDIGLASRRVVPSAVRLAMRADTAEQQSILARSICRDPLVCLAGILAFGALQLTTAAAPD